MMKNKAKVAGALFLLILIFSCTKDFIVKDISKDNVNVLFPSEGDTIESNAVTFVWEELDGAEFYNVQLVGGTFQKVKFFVTDTNVTGKKLSVSLDPGNFEWRISGRNSGHETEYRNFKFVIDSTSNLSGMTVNLLNPANGTATNSIQVAFVWKKVVNATEYNVVINNGELVDTIVVSNSFNYTVPAVNGSVTTFTWNVRALNSNSQSRFNTVPFKFTVDLAPPLSPSLLTPLSGAAITNTASLTWNRNSPTDVNYDSLFVATDSLFTNIISRNLLYASTVKILDLQNSPSPNGSFYWWRVRSIDFSGNRSNVSGQFKFKLNP